MAAFKSLLSFVTVVGVANALVLTQKRADGGYIQQTSGQASFTHYSGCGMPACGVAASGYTAAINQLAFGSIPGLGPGDACGRCFAITADHDPYSPDYSGPFGQTIVVKVTDMCPVQGNEVWCGQTATQDTNQYGQPFHFDICEDTGAAAAFFPSGHGALTGSFVEVPCSQWSGSDGSSLWPGSCIAGESAGLWPTVGCGNQGTAPGSNASPATTGAHTSTTVTPTAVASPTAVSPTTVATPTTVADTTTSVDPVTLVQTTSTAAAVTTTDANVCVPSSTSSASGATQTHWGQCGGTDYTGATACESPYTCQAVSPPWYYQCL